MTHVHVYRVFVNDEGAGGGPVGIVVDAESALSASERQRIATQLDFGETVFINDIEKRSISIYTRLREIPFAGHAVVGTAYFFAHELRQKVTQLHGSGGAIDVAVEDDVTWARAELKTMPPWWHERLASAAEIEALHGPQSDNQTRTQLWAWIDEATGTVRSRTFASEFGVIEDEVNGSGSMRLAAALGREIIVHHGESSLIYARPSGSGYAAVGGKVVREMSLTV